MKAIGNTYRVRINSPVNHALAYLAAREFETKKLSPNEIMQSSASVLYRDTC